MRRFCILLLIALLPLRGWSAGDMAVQMAVGELASASIGAMHGAMPEHCLMMSEAGTPADGVVLGDGQAERGCQACQLCMSLAPYEVLTVRVMSFPSSGVYTPRSNRFNSAERARALKPPIS
jgi:hypothetical protein